MHQAGGTTGSVPANALPLTDSMTLRSSPTRKPEPRTERQSVHEICENWTAKYAQKGAKMHLKTPYFSFFCPFMETSRAAFTVVMKICNRTFLQIGNQSGSLWACRPTNVWACRPTFNFHLFTVHCSLFSAPPASAESTGP